MKNKRIVTYAVFTIFAFFTMACSSGDNNNTPLPIQALMNQKAQPCPQTNNPLTPQTGCVQQVAQVVTDAPQIKAAAQQGQPANIPQTGPTGPSNPAAVPGMGPASVDDKPTVSQDRTSISLGSMGTASVDDSSSGASLAAAQPVYETEGVSLPSYDSPESDLRQPAAVESAPQAAPPAEHHVEAASASSGGESLPPTGGAIR